jgi:hypothetical protein
MTREWDEATKPTRPAREIQRNRAGAIQVYGEREKPATLRVHSLFIGQTAEYPTPSPVQATLRHHLSALVPDTHCPGIDHNAAPRVRTHDAEPRMIRPRGEDRIAGAANERDRPRGRQSSAREWVGFTILEEPSLELHTVNIAPRCSRDIAVTTVSRPIARTTTSCSLTTPRQTFVILTQKTEKSFLARLRASMVLSANVVLSLLEQAARRFPFPLIVGPPGYRDRIPGGGCLLTWGVCHFGGHTTRGV